MSHSTVTGKKKDTKQHFQGKILARALQIKPGRLISSSYAVEGAMPTIRVHPGTRWALKGVRSARKGKGKKEMSSAENPRKGPPRRRDRGTRGRSIRVSGKRGRLCGTPNIIVVLVQKTMKKARQGGRESY